MDHMMPDIDGIEAVRIIREEIGTEYAKTVPIIALTANAILGTEEVFLSKGFQAFISKPIDIMQLDSILNTWIAMEESHDDTGYIKEKYTYQFTDEPKPDLLEGIAIDGMDFVKGIQMFSSEGAYLEVLRSFLRNTPPLLEKIRGFNTEAIPDLPEYAVIVHGLKGSCYSISANIAGTEAAKLETAAKTGDIEQVMEKNLLFISMIESLLADLGKVLQKAAAHDTARRETKMTVHAPDPELLSQLLEAAKLYNASKIVYIINELESFEYESGGNLVVWLREQMDNMEYDSIKNRLIKNMEELDYVGSQKEHFSN
jgi:CheY-like chemotaxis protein